MKRLFVFSLVPWVLPIASLDAAPSVAQSPRVVMVDELLPLYPDSDPTPGSRTLVTHTPRGCIAGIHLLTRHLTPDARLSFEVAAPEWLSTQLYRLVAVPVEVNSGVSSRTETFDGKINPDVIRRAPFHVYDVLEPVDHTIRVTTAHMAFALHCTIPADAPVGAEPIHIILHQDGQPIATLHWDLRLARSVVPPVGRHTMGYTNWLSYGNIAKWHRCKKWSEAYWVMIDHYLELLAANRQNMLLVPLKELFERDQDHQWILNQERLRRLVHLCDRHHIYWLEGGHLGRRPNNDWSSTHLELRFDASVTPTDGARTEVQQICGQLYRCLEENHWTERWVQHLSDEPTDVLANDYAWLANEVKAAMPGMKIFEATLSRELTGAVDLWCPTVDKYQANRTFFDGRKAAGDRVWVYTCLTPTGPWLNRLLDMERLRPVYVGWGLAKYDLDGFLHWGGNHWNVDPYTQSVIKHPAVRDKDTNNELPAGDTHILYPKDGSICGSLRLRAHAIGAQDYELLRQAQTQHATATREILDKAFRAFNDYEKRVDHYRTTRLELIRLLESDGRADPPVGE